ncbi:tellurite resistance protein TerC [Cryobacterium sp. MP_M5]|uniref:TerC family protein n=1 Tax=unclassified Cryobacterium TaxID=2649013 RepID=UPI0018C920B8|nr:MULTISPECIES: TerC family protein [unclassified Cryobacterium]MBG6057961.1 tellurite resistance protein TerC [Cryobacterium sp. MP_M3]MEC5176160.1 tellurite resistance protein TerC [Cryobacterium sp. MP_M5]
MNVPLSAWLIVFGAIAVMLAVDLFAHRTAHVIGVREAAAWSVAWVLVAVGFGAGIWVVAGAEFGQQYFAGYLIEKSLSVDNVFVWAIIFSAFAVPRQYQHRVLFLGVVGALVLRGAFIAAGAILIESFSWVLYLFAAFLIYTGYRMIRQRNEHVHPEKSPVLRVFRRLVPMTDAFHEQRLLIRRGGVLLATPLLAVLVLVEVTDVVFAVDSIPAIFAVTSEPFIVFAANAFAILGLRAMYFLLADLMHRFVYLRIGLALVLVWVGVKMLLLDLFYVPTTVSLLVVASIIGVSIVLSLRATRGQGRRPVAAESAGAFRMASAEEIEALEPIWGAGSRRTEKDRAEKDRSEKGRG